MSEEIINPDEEIKVTESEPESESDESTKLDPINKLYEIYNQIADTDDIAQKTAALLTTTNYYSHAIKISNILNGRQGKNRVTVTGSTSQLMAYSLETDLDEITDKHLTELLVSIIDTYLADKQELPSNERLAAGILSRVKALIIMLITTNNFSIIHMIKIPLYVLKMTTNIFDQIREIEQSILDDFVKYLIDSGNAEMAEIVVREGKSFWGTEGIKADVLYDRYFGELANQGKIKNPTETYQKYLQFRAEYRKSTKSILPSRMYDIFQITQDAYSRARQNVYYELNQLFPEDKNIEVIKRLLYE